MRTEHIFVIRSCIRIKGASKTGSFPTDRSIAVLLLQFFFVCRWFYVIICSSSLLPLVPREGCDSLLCHSWVSSLIHVLLTEILLWECILFPLTIPSRFSVSHFPYHCLWYWGCALTRFRLNKLSILTLYWKSPISVWGVLGYVI